MKIPKKVKIGPHTYKVKLENNMGINHECVGQSRSQFNEIVLDPGQAQTQLEDSLLHEIIHAIDDQIKLFPKGENEEPISRLTSELLQLIQDNPEMFK